MKAAAYEMPAWPVDGMDVAGRRATPRAGRSRRCAAAGDRTSSSCAPTGSGPIRCSTPSATATRPRSRTGSSATRSTRWRARLDGGGTRSTADDIDATRGEGRRARSTARGRVRRGGDARARRGADPLRLLGHRSATGGQPMTKTTYREAMREALRAAHAPPTIGSSSWARTSARYGGCFAVSLGLLRGVRSRADPRHPAVGVGVRRCRHRRGPRRHAADRRDHDGQLQPARARPDHEQRRHAAPHERRPVQRAAGDPA